MHRTPVESSNITSVGWSNNILEVEFASNHAVYQFDGVPRSEYDNLMHAMSVGKYFCEHIKNSGYPYRRVDSDTAGPWPGGKLVSA